MIHYFLLTLFLASCAPLGHKEIKLPPGENFLVMQYGKIHRSCLEKFGQTMVDKIDEAGKDGLACLKGLNKSGSSQLVEKLVNLHAKKSVTYTCQDTDFGWRDDYWAMGSIDKVADEPELNLYHPYIAIHPNKDPSSNTSDLKTILFHESLHNLGYNHGGTPDYSYACAECCMPMYPSDQDLACKICSTKYSGVSDPRYAKDFWSWVESSHMRSFLQTHRVIRRALSEKPGSKFWLEKLYSTERSSNYVLKYVFKNSKLNIDTEAQSLIPLAQKLGAAEVDLYVKGNHKRLIRFYLDLDTTFLVKGMKSNKSEIRKVSYSLWRSYVYDFEEMRNFVTKTKLIEEKDYLKKIKEIYGIKEFKWD